MSRVPRGTPPPPPADLADRLARYAAAVRSSPVGLTSPRAARELESRHLPECLALAERLPPGPAEVVDVGSGAGLPGVVIALRRPDLRVTLVEANARRAAFLRRVCRELALEVTVRRDRIEHCTDLRVDIAVARAVAPLPRLVPLVLPVLRPGGRLYAVKGETWAEELAALGDPARWGAVVEAVPAPEDHPRVVIIRRVEEA